MKKVFLISDYKAMNLINGEKVLGEIDNTNHLVTQIKELLTNKKNKLVYVASSPSDFDTNDYYSQLAYQSFKNSNIVFNDFRIIDNRINKDSIHALIHDSDLIYLTGGDTKKQMDYFEKINLKEILKTYEGIIVGHSAGAINLATSVICSPEYLEEIERTAIWAGLGMTEINIEPHFVFDVFDDTDKILRNELLKLSFNETIYAIVDGAHVFDDGSNVVLYGESYLIHDGIIESLCKDGEKYRIN